MAISQATDDPIDETSRWLLVSDIDDTLIGDDAALEQFADVVSRAEHLLLALNSSRPSASVDATLADLSVPLRADALICAMGTEIRIHGRFAGEWTDQFAGWNRSVVDEVMCELGFDAHAPQLQTPYKASYAVPSGEDQQRAIEAIRQTGLKSRIICSGASDMDVLPSGAGKDHATLWLAERLGVTPARLIVAGDSANDLAMFSVAQKGIVVGNARAELKDAVNRDTAYVADRACAGGLLEGLIHWGAVAAATVKGQ